MSTLTVHIPAALKREIIRVAGHKKISKSELVRRAAEQYLARNVSGGDVPSALDLAGELVGSLHGLPADLASSRRQLERYGR
jgi:hypothetical protein